MLPPTTASEVAASMKISDVFLRHGLETVLHTMGSETVLSAPLRDDPLFGACTGDSAGEQTGDRREKGESERDKKISNKRSSTESRYFEKDDGKSEVHLGFNGSFDKDRARSNRIGVSTLEKIERANYNGDKYDSGVVFGKLKPRTVGTRLQRGEDPNSSKIVSDNLSSSVGTCTGIDVHGSSASNMQTVEQALKSIPLQVSVDASQTKLDKSVPELGSFVSSSSPSPSPSSPSSSSSNGFTTTSTGSFDQQDSDINPAGVAYSDINLTESSEATGGATDFNAPQCSTVIKGSESTTSLAISRGSVGTAGGAKAYRNKLEENLSGSSSNSGSSRRKRLKYGN